MEQEKGSQKMKYYLVDKYDEIEFLFLKNIGHRRSKFSWINNNVAMEWLIP